MFSTMIPVNSRLLSMVTLGIFLRYTLRFSSYYSEISKRVEVASPVNAWIRVVEGVHLKQLNISSYDGDTFHESPISLRFYQFLLNYLSDFQIAIFFIIIDVTTAFILAQVAVLQLNIIEARDRQRLNQYLKDHDDKKLCENLFIKRVAIENCSEWIVSIHALSPYSILPCVAQSTSVLNNFLIALLLLNATKGKRFFALTLLAISCVNTFYTLILLPPVILILKQFNDRKSSDQSSAGGSSQDLSQFTTMGYVITSLLFFTLVSIALFSICLWLEGGSLRFVNCTYIFMWTVSDLTPNIGLFWYLFAEMFDHFRAFFLWVFQINFFIYIIPLSLKLGDNPFFLGMIALMNHSVFKPYPTVADFALYLCLLPQWSHLFQYMKSTLVVSGTIVTTSVLAPILWYLWIILGTANSNFYFGITLAFNIGQIFLITDLIFAHIKREFYITNINFFKLCKKAEKSPRIELSYD